MPDVPPLTNDQLKRLSDLTGVHFLNLANHTGNKGPQISFDRPELSPCLKAFQDKNAPEYKEALEIIRAGAQMLQQVPRADMPGFTLAGVDAEREQKYTLLREIEKGNRKAIRTGAKEYDRATTN